MLKFRSFVCILVIFYILQLLIPIPSLVMEAASQGSTKSPHIADYYVTPEVGDEQTVFTYYAVFNYTYTYPREVQVEIDGKYRYNMTFGDENHQMQMYYTYSTKLAEGKHNFTIVYNDYYSNWTTEYETNVTWEPTVWRNEAYLNQTTCNTTTVDCYLNVYKGLLNATVEGDLIGTVNFTSLEMVIINQSSFDGFGFALANWEATIETKPYNGTWKSMIYKKAGERKYYLKGTISGGLKGFTEGYLTESTANSDVFDVYNSTWTICKLGEHYVYADLLLNGTVDYHSTSKVDTSLYIIQASFSGTASGYYNGSLNIVLTHVRINNASDPYYGQGFSSISYNTINGTGKGWTVDCNSSTAVTTMNGYFTEPLLSIIRGELNESGKNKTLYIYFYRIKLESPPQAKLIFRLWGPGRVSPGQTVSYVVKYYNYGLKGVYGVTLELKLASTSKISYISNTGGGTYNTTTNSVFWTKDLPPETSGHLSVKIKVKWGLPQNTILNFYLYVNITESTLIKHLKCLVTTARDPNEKHGPEGVVRPGKKLDYQIEFENEGKGIAFGVYFTDTLDDALDETTLSIGPVKDNKDNSIITSAGTYDPGTRTITWFVGEVGPGEGGYANVSINVRSDAAHDTIIINYATVYFPSVPEETRTNAIITTVRLNQAPKANAGMNKFVDTLEDVIFDGSGSSDSDGTIVDYSWDFGDGNSDSGQKVTHQYTDDGLYTVKLTVEDNEGLTDSHSILVIVRNQKPVAVLDASPKEVKTLEEITFDASSSYDPDGDYLQYKFDFGDGVSSGWVDTSSFKYKYSDGGTYTASLSVRDVDFEVSTNVAEVEITVLNQKPAAKLSVTPLEAQTYEDIQCSAELSSDIDGTISHYYFDFDDGENSGWITSPSVKHQYTDGTKYYDITLQVKDNHGELSDVSSVKVLINNRLPTAKLTVDRLEAYTFEDFSFDASGSSDMDGTLEYFFDFGDDSDSGWLKTPKTIHQYSDGPNEYDVKLTVKDDDGDTDTSTVKITVKNQIPIADAGLDQSTYAKSAVYFNIGNSLDRDGVIVSYQWDFGDGSTGDGLSTQHTYEDDGIFTVTLTVTDDDGDFSSDSCIITILNNAPISEFTVNEDSGTIETVFEFKSTAYDVDGTIEKLFWDFGDDTTSSESEPTHQYDKYGEYTVTLVVQDDDGSKSSDFSKAITVLNSKPAAEATVTPLTAEVGEEISFDASESYDIDNDALEFSWDFGDGNSDSGRIVKHTYDEKGTYKATLTVTDDKDNEAETTFEIEIDEKPTEDKSDTKEKSVDWTTVIIPIALILVLIVFFAMSLRRKKVTPEDEKEIEEEE